MLLVVVYLSGVVINVALAALLLWKDEHMRHTRGVLVLLGAATLSWFAELAVACVLAFVFISSALLDTAER